MSTNSTFRNGKRTEDKSGVQRPGRHARRDLPDVPQLDGTRIPQDRGLERINAAMRSLDIAKVQFRAAGIDPDAASTAFAIGREALNEIREIYFQIRRLQTSALYELEQANQVIGAQIPDMPGMGLFPDPSAAQTPSAFMDTLRMYHVWAGKPSYRTMEHRCARRFAASTIHAAFKSNEIPTLEMVLAIITACGGGDAHKQIFVTAWRRLVMMPPDAPQPSRSRALYPVSETA